MNPFFSLPISPAIQLLKTELLVVHLNKHHLPVKAMMKNKLPAGCKGIWFVFKYTQIIF